MTHAPWDEAGMLPPPLVPPVTPIADDGGRYVQQGFLSIWTGPWCSRVHGCFHSSVVYTPEDTILLSARCSIYMRQ